MRVTRRQVVQGVGTVGLVLGAGCGRWPGEAAQPRVRRIGFLAATTPVTAGANIEAFQRGLRELGYVEGQNLVIEYRWAEGRLERIPEFARELVELAMEVIVVAAPIDARAAREATSTIPIVVGGSGGGGDLVEAGLAASYARPGGNVTGLTNPFLGGKLLQLLHETVPAVSRVAMLTDPNAATVTPERYQVAAETLGLRLEPLEVRGPDDLAAAFEAARVVHAEALYDLASPMTFTHRARIVDLAARYELPAMYTRREFVDAGGLMSYQPRVADSYLRAATYVDKILKGANPADLPIERPTTFDFVINLKTAQALGLSIPQSVLLQATEVIQ